MESHKQRIANSRHRLTVSRVIMTWRTASRHVIPVEDEINGQGQTDYLFSLEERQQVDYSRKGKFLPWSSKSLANTKEVLCKSWIQSCQGTLKINVDGASKPDSLTLAQQQWA